MTRSCPACSAAAGLDDAWCRSCGQHLASTAGVAEPRSVPADMVGRPCPYCRFPLKAGGHAARCDSCGAVHHADCFSENGGCAVNGCAGAPNVRATHSTASTAPHVVVSAADARIRQGPPSPPPGSPATQPSSSRRLPIVAVVALALTVAVAGVAVAMLLSHNPTPVSSASAQTAGPSPTVTRTVTTQAQPTVEPPPTGPAHHTHPASRPAMTRFQGSDFSVDYPSGWSVTAAETQRSYGKDTTIESGTGALLRVDVSATAPSPDPMQDAQPVIDALRRLSSYRELDLSRTTFQGNDAVHWEFENDDDQGVPLHKEDIFFVDPNGRGVAVFTQAPASRYGALRRTWSRARASLRMHT